MSHQVDCVARNFFTVQTPGNVFSTNLDRLELCSGSYCLSVSYSATFTLSLQVHHSLLHFYNNYWIILDHAQLSVTLISQSGSLFSFNIAEKACFDCGHHGVKNTLVSSQVITRFSRPDADLSCIFLIHCLQWSTCSNSLCHIFVPVLRV